MYDFTGINLVEFNNNFEWFVNIFPPGFSTFAKNLKISQQSASV